MKKKEQAI